MPEGEVTPERRAFYEYHSSLMEPWDGPAAVTYTDGRIVGTIMDRNGLRPARYVVLDNGIVICASESGSVAYDESRVIKKGRIGPGQIFCVDTTRGAVMDDEEITQKFAAAPPLSQVAAGEPGHPGRSRGPPSPAACRQAASLPAPTVMARANGEQPARSGGREPEQPPGVLWLHQRRDDCRPAPDAHDGPGAGRRDGRRHAACRHVQAAAPAFLLLQAAFCRGDQPAHRPAARRDGDEPAHAAGPARQPAGRNARGDAPDRTQVAHPAARTDGSAARLASA